MGVRYNRLTFRSACLLKGERREVRCRGAGNAPDGMIDGTETLAENCAGFKQEKRYE